MSEFLAEVILNKLRTVLDGLFKSYHTYTVGASTEEICIRAQRTEQENEQTLVLRILINDVEKKVLITNIYIPSEFQFNGYGKKLILITLGISRQFDYSLFIVDAIPSFHAKLVKCGAIEINETTINITENTCLA